ncbi:MAG: pectin esterase [Bacteroides sp.]|nr:pectin esterase [Barnesiella sp.]MBD5368280.1 pectin esterase [Bacteroides sp.]
MYKNLIRLIAPAMAALMAMPAMAQTFSNEDASISWPFESATDYASFTATPEDGFSAVTVNLGNATITGVEVGSNMPHANGITFAKVQPKNSGSDVVEWTVKPAKGLTFTPTHVFGYIARFGTDAEDGVTVSARLGNGEVVTLGTYTAWRNTKDNTQKYGNKATDQFDITLTADQQAKLKGADGFTLMASIGVGNAKQGGFSHITIDGKIDGTVVEVNKYTATIQASPAQGGEVKISPVQANYEEGTKVTFSAEKNFGYKFVNWTDASGKEVSKDAVFSVEIKSDLNYTANFAVIPTYELSYSVDGGANLYQVQLLPAPTVVDGKNMYEEGATVVLQAISNPIVTFTNWSDGQSSSEISVKMTEDKEFVAYFSAIDFIAGWDFYKSGTGRSADFYSADNDNASLVLRNAAGDTSSWLDKSQEAAGGYEGRPAAVNWRTTGLGDYYWQTKVNASAFTDIKVVTAMLYNFNAYSRQNVEYSLDGENWTKLGSISIEGAKNWTDATFNLPAEANNQENLFIRFISDKTSTVAGSSSSNDGIALGETYIIGNKELINDGTAPVLVSFVPEEGNSNASINGKIVLTFDEKVKVKDGATATLGDFTLQPSVTGKTVLFAYKNLTYGTSYKFTLAANTVSDLTDNYLAEPITINFSTKTRPSVEKALYDFVVPTDGKLEDAFAAAEAREDDAARFRIFILNGDYKLPASATATKTGSDGKSYPDPTTYLNTPNVSFIGESVDGVVITNTLPSNGSVLEGIGNGDVLRIEKSAKNTYFQNLTMKSSMGDNKGRDIVVNDNADKTIMKDVCLWGYQDTYVSNNENARYYFEGGLLRGRTDFLCGKGDVYYNAVTLQMCGDGGYIAVPSKPRKYGYIFKDCEIVGEKDGLNGKYNLGRPWGEGTPIALFIDTKMNIIPTAAGWADMGSDGHPARFAEYNSFTAAGSAVDLSGRKTTFGSGKHTNNPVLTAAEAAANSYETVMGGDDDWDPATLAEQAAAPTGVVLDGNTLKWNNDDYCLLWAIVKNGKVVDFTTEPVYLVDDAKASWGVRAANEMGGLSEVTLATSGSGINTVTAGSSVVSTIYYNVEGKRVNASYKGFVIKVDTLNDGSTVATKTVNE